MSQAAYRTVGLCQNCGYTWNPNANSANGGKKGTPTWLWVLGWICIFPLPLTILLLRKKDMKPALKYGIIAAAWILYLIIGLSGTSENTNNTSSTQTENNDVDDVMIEWHDYVVEMREKELVIIIEEERLKEDETRKFLENAFREGEVKTVGTDIDKIMPPVSRFGGGNRANKKKTVIDRLKAYFDKFYGVGGAVKFTKDDTEE